MGGFGSGYSPSTSDPSTTLLRSSGRDDKGRGVTFRKISDLDGQGFKQMLCEDRRSTPLRFGWDKGRGVAVRELFGALMLKRCLAAPLPHANYFFVL
jgi:hypothetical protein